MSSRVISAVLTLRDKDFTKNIKRASDNSDDFQRRITHVGNGVKRFGTTATQTFKNIATGIGGISLVGLSAGVTALTTGVASSVFEMDKSFARMSAKTGATEQELKDLEGVAKSVFTSGFGENITDVANNVSMLKTMFGELNKTELTNLSKGVSTIAELFDQDVKEVGKTVKGMVENFEGLTETEAMDLLTTAFKDTGDYANDLLDTFNEYSVHFAKLGLSGQEFAGILSNASGAFNLDKVGDAVKEFGIRAIDGEKTTVEGFEAIGLSADEMAEKIGQGGESANNAFTATLAGLAAIEDPVKRNAAGVKLFGTQWEDLRDDVITSMVDGKTAIQDFEGATAKASDNMHDNIGDRLTGAWRKLKIGIADMVSSGDGKKLLDSIATSAENLVPKIQGIIQKALDFGNTIRDNWTPISNTLVVIGSAVGAFAVVMGTLKIVSGITTLINGFRTAMTLATAGQWAMNTAMLASPMTWVAVGIAGVVAAGVLLYKNWDTVKTKATELWTKIKEVFGNIFDWGMNKIQPIVNVFKSLGDKFSSFKEKITSFKLPDWVNNAGEKIGGALSKAKDMLPSFDVGTNNVASDMTANIHKGEMIIPARQAERLRQQGINIDNIDKVKGSGNTDNSTTVSTITNSSNAKNEVNINIYPTGTTAAQVINEIVPQLKLVLANL